MTYRDLAAGVLLSVWCAIVPGAAEQPAMPAGASTAGLPDAAVPVLRAGIAHLYNLDLDRAERCFTDVIGLASNHPAGHVYLAVALVSRVMCEGMTDEYDIALTRCLRRAIEALGATDDAPRDAWHDVYIGAVFIVRAQQMGLRAQYLDALHLLKRAAARLERAAQAPAAAADAGVLLGAYQFFCDYTPWYMRHFAGLFVAPTDRAEGLRRLDHGVRQAVMLQPEALMLASVAHAWQRNDDRAEELAATLTNRFPGNPQWGLLLQYVLLRAGKHEAALASASGAVARLEFSARPLARALLPDQHYQCGVIYAAQSNYHRALTHFGAAAVLGERKTRLRAWALLRQGTMHDLLGDRGAAQSCYRAVRAGRHVSDTARAYASQFIDQPYAGQELE